VSIVHPAFIDSMLGYFNLLVVVVVVADPTGAFWSKRSLLGVHIFAN
jgi:hypothetical protein